MISKLELNDFFFLMSSLIPGMFKSITKNINININLKLDYIVFEEACYMAKLCFYKMYTFIKKSNWRIYTLPLAFSNNLF